VAQYQDLDRFGAAGPKEQQHEIDKTFERQVPEGSNHVVLRLGLRVRGLRLRIHPWVGAVMDALWFLPQTQRSPSP